MAASVMARLAALPDRDAAFVQQKHVSSLAAPVSTSGRLTFRHPAHLEQVTTSPRPERLVIDHGVLDITEDGGATRRIALDPHPALQALATTIGDTLAGDLGALQQIYTVTATGTVGTWHILLTPRTDSLRRFIKTVTLAGNGNALHEVDIALANGDSQLMAIQPSP